jgi:hypothetical protein
MFRCDNCGSGYSVMAASAWHACPRCLAKEKVSVPLTFELGWRGPGLRSESSAQADGPGAEAEGSARDAASS